MNMVALFARFVYIVFDLISLCCLVMDECVPQNNFPVTCTKC